MLPFVTLKVTLKERPKQAVAVVSPQFDESSDFGQTCSCNQAILSESFWVSKNICANKIIVALCMFNDNLSAFLCFYVDHGYLYLSR